MKLRFLKNNFNFHKDVESKDTNFTFFRFFVFLVLSANRNFNTKKAFVCRELLSLLKALLHSAIFSATCLAAMLENVALQVSKVGCCTTTRSQQLATFFGHVLVPRAPRNKKREVCACALVKTSVKLREKLLEGRYRTIQWCCKLPLSVAKSRAEFYFVQRFAQQRNRETTHFTLCNSLATCRDKLLRKLCSV